MTPIYYSQGIKLKNTWDDCETFLFLIGRNKSTLEIVSVKKEQNAQRSLWLLELALQVSSKEKALYRDRGYWDLFFWLLIDGPFSHTIWEHAPVKSPSKTYKTRQRAQLDTPSTQSLPHAFNSWVLSAAFCFSVVSFPFLSCFQSS